MRFARTCWCLLSLLSLAACGGMADDLAPSGSDDRPPVREGTTGPAVGQNAPDFTLPDTVGGSATLSSALAEAKSVVLYFTMWCPVCDEHMSHLRSVVIPDNPDVRFFVVDYVSGSVEQARDAQVANGYANAGFTVLADTDGTVRDLYDATMGSTVVVDRAGVIRMNEDYKDGARLQTALRELP